MERPTTPAPPSGFPVDPDGLPEARRPEVVDLASGNTFDLGIGPVAKRIGEATVRMLAYNGSIPGPTLRVRQGSEVAVNVTNGAPLEQTVHWHGLRLENRYDGVPHETQAPIPVGGTYTHRLRFPDAGLFWYHPHIREDYAQEMGLYANIIVTPADPEYWPPADREIVLTLDDILLVDGAVAPFTHAGPDHVAMGRFGNVLLVGGETHRSMEVEAGEVVRLLLTNTANTRVFRVGVPGVPMKLVGADGGRYEREEMLEEVIIAPSERAVIDVLFDRPGKATLEHRSSDRSHPLLTVAVTEPVTERPSAVAFADLRSAPEMKDERKRIGPYLWAPPDKVLAMIAEMDAVVPKGETVVYACPMHPEVVSDEPGSCPRCGMKLLPTAAGEAVGGGADHHGRQGDHHDHGTEDGIEWEDLMPEVNRISTPATMRWKLVDRQAGTENAAIDWEFRVGDHVKIRLVNEMDSDHPMHHPFHIHGERFLVLARDGIEEPNLVWKDTVLVRTGETVDILMDASNPGLWMAHCHIAEHAESGMMFSFRVASSAR